ncbi:S8 family serine peptidase [Pyxidicoccus parkwayensis]|uniref:S8 family serine peptidase n=1 Tax=Pyxidicoccus parkwayensis TaxID=2813578 RepID=A0ABX7P0N9_9BACT|nr:S8 family serine peptidase [Pyxidicoccus parkwaysis]QSQ24650.1 S8 family serine peptidase [Pyxidicoccus parkwaysis]
MLLKSSFLAQRLFLGLLLVTSISAQARAGRTNNVPSIERPANPIKGQYIFTFDETLVTPEEAQAAAEELTEHLHATLLFVYDGGFLGFAASGLNDGRAVAIGTDRRIKSVAQDGQIEMDAVQNNAQWDLDRLDTHPRVYDTRYVQSTTGQGVNVYVIDTGIRTSHVEFGGRATQDFTAINDGFGASDCNGHGTHVAGTVGGTTFGVAKGVRLHAVRVLDCNGSGSASGVIAGIDWVTKNHQKPAVANMSLSSGAYSPTDDAVRASIAAGVTYVAAASNSDADACTRSPARTPEVLTVAASDINDVRASFSNWGACVDLFAPGVDILSAWLTSDTASARLNGTSMASPHVAGVAALYLQRNPTASPAAVTQAILGASTPNLIQDPNGSPNRFLYSLVVPLDTAFEEVPPPPGVTPKQVAVGSANNIWLLDTVGRHYKWNGSGWTSLSCCVSELAASSDGALWATNPPDSLRVLRWTGSVWAFNIPTGMKQVTIANANTIWGLDPTGYLYRYTGSAWEQKICCVDRISIGEDGVMWATNPADDLRVLEWNGTSWNAFTRPKGMIYVSVGNASNIWGLDPSNHVFKFNGSSWAPVLGSLVQISAAADGTVWGIGTNGQIQRFVGP